MKRIEGDLRRFRVNASNPCPVCGKADWCLADGSEWAICTRNESPYRWKDVGWFHDLTKSGGQSAIRPVEASPTGMAGRKKFRPASAGLWQGKLVATYLYRDERGHPLYRKQRFVDPEGKKFTPFQKFIGGPPDQCVSWQGGQGCMEGVRRVLYRLDQLVSRPDELTFIVEGEKAADCLAMRGLLATTNDDGAEKWRPEFSDFFRGREVAILPDNDPPGRRHGELVARALYGIARSIRVVHLPGLGEKEDIYDWFEIRKIGK